MMEMTPPPPLFFFFFWKKKIKLNLSNSEGWGGGEPWVLEKKKKQRGGGGVISIICNWEREGNMITNITKSGSKCSVRNTVLYRINFVVKNSIVQKQL